MSYQKKRSKPTTLSQGARGCNFGVRTVWPKIDREAMNDHDRITAILAGTHWTRERQLADRMLPSRKVDRHQYLPHQSDREITKNSRKSPRLFT